jgi:hypothetical protein
MADDDKNDDKAGYGKPPKHSRFKPGKSGNPRGRPRRSRNLKTDLAEELRTPVTVREGGREMRVSKQRAMVMGLISKAVQGEAKAIDKLVDLIERLIVEQEEHRPSTPMSPEELEILETLGERFQSPSSPPHTEQNPDDRKERPVANASKGKGERK